MNSHWSDLLFCHHLTAKGFKPYAVMDGKEIISYPFPERGGVCILARTTVGDPTTMRQFQILRNKLTEVR